jgi:hypothetical protein
MPFFEANPFKELTLGPNDLDGTLELGGLDEAEAIERLQRLLRSAQDKQGHRFAVRFDAPAGDGVETLFLPIGRFLLDLRRHGRIRRCLLLSDGHGYYFELAAKVSA